MTNVGACMALLSSLSRDREPSKSGDSVGLRKPAVTSGRVQATLVSACLGISASSCRNYACYPELAAQQCKLQHQHEREEKNISDSKMAIPGLRTTILKTAGKCPKPEDPPKAL